MTMTASPRLPKAHRTADTPTSLEVQVRVRAGALPMTKLKSRFISEATAPPAGRVSSGCISNGYSHPSGPPGMSQMIHCMLLCTLIMRHALGRRGLLASTALHSAYHLKARVRFAVQEQVLACGSWAMLCQV